MELAWGKIDAGKSKKRAGKIMKVLMKAKRKIGRAEYDEYMKSDQEAIKAVQNGLHKNQHFRYKDTLYLKEANESLKAGVWLSTDVLHFACVRELEELRGKGVTNANKAYIMHGDFINVLKNKTTVARNTRKIFKEALGHELVIFPFIDTNHILLAMLQQKEETNTLFIMDSWIPNESRYTKVEKCCIELLKSDNKYNKNKFERRKLEAASQGENETDCGVFSVIFMKRFLTDPSGKGMTEAIEQEERDELRRKWKAEFDRAATEWSRERVHKERQ